MRLSRKYVIVSAVVVLGGIIAVWSLSGRKAEADGEDAARPAAVARVERHPLDSSITLSGEFRPFQEVDVHAKVAGYIRTIYVDVGDRVKEGQTLAVLEVPELQAQVQGAEASIRRDRDAIRRAESDVRRSESAYAAHHAAYTRLKQASEQRPGLIAEQELDDSMAKDKESEANVGSAQAALAEARNQLNIAEANRQQLAAMEAYTRITAPFSGIITKRYADTGSLIQAGTASSTQAMPVVRLAEADKFRLTLPVPESAVPLVHLGSTVQVRVPALRHTFEGRVARFADALDQQTRTMHTEVDVVNKDSLVLGMYAEVDLVLEHKATALTVPVQAVSRNGGESSVLVVGSDNRLEERKVRLGMEGAHRLEITSGLQEGERVVIGSRSQFRTGERVTPKLVRTGGEGGL
ncbi:MAG TPA: efflux RND transporter periplasmic adaptor subunit [Terriglobales bacterium]|nr:efflux RND transporter periplasmic adaptor subunit [Terriglobales bacterium]